MRDLHHQYLPPKLSLKSADPDCVSQRYCASFEDVCSLKRYSCCSGCGGHSDSDHISNNKVPEAVGLAHTRRHSPRLERLDEYDIDSRCDHGVYTRRPEYVYLGAAQEVGGVGLA